MLPSKASEFFHGSEGYNCAQAVAAAYTAVRGEGGPPVESLEKSGGGRAEGGLCGALYAASLLLSDPADRARLEERFLAEAGATRCREIRKRNRLDCRGCVRTAAQFLDETIPPAP